MEAWPALVAGTGSGLLAGFYLAFSLVVMPALERRPGSEAASAMIAINRAAARAPFLVLFFGTAAAALVVLGTGGSGPAAPVRVLGGLAVLAGWILTMVVNVPLNARLARTDRRTVVWSAYARPWRQANHARAGLSVLGFLALVLPLS